MAVQEIERFEEMANRMLWGSRRSWNKEIRATIDKFKGAMQSHLSKSGSSGNFVEEVKLEIQSFAERVKKMEDELVDELYQDDDDDDDVSSPIGSEMVGLSDQYDEIKRKIINAGADLKVFSIVGMGGIGKTALARRVYEDRDVEKQFDLRVWVTVGRKCRPNQILHRIVAELYSDQVGNDHDEVVRMLREILKGKKYIIVLDDVWGSKYVEYHLQISYKYIKNEMKNPFPDQGNGSRVLLTTRLHQVNEINHRFIDDLSVRLLNKRESWDLLREKVFGEEPCPFKLEKFGKKIAEKCDGLPLTIVTIAKLLSEVDKTLECWKEIAAHKRHQIFVEAYERVSKVLLPSYKHLPRILQMCFLYMGVFPIKYEISVSKLTNMWKTDGFLELKAREVPYPSELEYLDELVLNNLMIIHSTTRDESLFGGKQYMKTCGLHSSSWYLCNKEGRKAKFFHVLNSFHDCSGQGIEGQQRLSFHNNVLLGIKQVHESVEENCSSTAHSLLCYGPYQKYPVPICFSLRLLKKLDALTIRFYDFPMEIMQLDQLLYLTLTLDGEIPGSISQLLNLQFLIVGQHLSLKPRSGSSHLPVEIWDMKELQHLQVMGRDLPNPCRTYLEKLSTLLGVGALSCAVGILETIPRLTKLSIQIELVPDEDGDPLSSLGHVSCLRELKSLKYVAVNPDMVVPLHSELPAFPRNIRKLSLGGLGYPWREMSIIGSLPFLYMLKLRSYAFQGPVWEVEEKRFISLVTLVIEDTDLVEWRFGDGSFISLGQLSIKHCYNLERIEGELQVYLENIEVIECGPLAENCVEQIRKDRMGKRDILPEPDVDLVSTWLQGYPRP
ncbi:putative late blight resistance protein homolog R1A-10 isoform X1 [Salvia splendens]|uniref:putative late blight resistance protein homolog R1A-10 isoform X1 n=1 Tax=Salvia splendens TaxID=180675 RepID=UPI001C27E018|nr:putative late blight resistance protein homolog R1A-10 isoform X1 [Salvia splendens]